MTKKPRAKPASPAKPKAAATASNGWVRVEDRLPPLNEPVLIASRQPNWTPGVAWRAARPGAAWAWEDHHNGDDAFEGLEYWRPIEPLPPLQATERPA